MGELTIIDKLSFYVKHTRRTLKRRQTERNVEAVLGEYTGGWDSYKRLLDSAETMQDWMHIRGVEDLPAYCNIEGRLSYVAFDSQTYNREKLVDAIRENFPDARSITEYGCGIGRNLLHVSESLNIDCYGYELTPNGVEVAADAAKKFGRDVKYAQLDYLMDDESKFVFPSTDVAFTMYSLEQLPSGAEKALRNILSHTSLGSIHIEPVPENYPWSLRGCLGRIEHRRVDYLSGFTDAVAKLDLAEVKATSLRSAHNPLMFPSLYVLRKR